MSEEWRDVLGYEGYYRVSSLGQVMRVRGGMGATAGRILKQKRPTHHCDYLRIQLCRNDAKRTVQVHVLVAEAFHGKRPRGKLPNHKDLNKLNNHADNLEWLTRRQNTIHALRNGGRVKPTALHGTRNGRHKLIPEQVRIIRDLRGVVGQRDLAVLCGVSKSAIQWIHQGKHWMTEWPEDLRVREMPMQGACR